MDRHPDRTSDPTFAGGDGVVSASEFGDDWVHEIIAMTRPGAEIRFPVRAISEREIPFVYDDFS